MIVAPSPRLSEREEATGLFAFPLEAFGLPGPGLVSDRHRRVGDVTPGTTRLRSAPGAPEGRQTEAERPYLADDPEQRHVAERAHAHRPQDQAHEREERQCAVGVSPAERTPLPLDQSFVVAHHYSFGEGHGRSCPSDKYFSI